jgi:hypothetical protein
MRTEKAVLKRKIEKGGTDERMRAEQQRKMTEGLRRDGLAREKRLKELERTNQQQKALLKRKTAEAISARRKQTRPGGGRGAVDPLRGRGSKLPPSKGRAKGRAKGKRVDGKGEEEGVSTAAHTAAHLEGKDGAREEDDAPLTPEEEEERQHLHVKWLDGLLAECLQQQQRGNALARSIRKRDERREERGHVSLRKSKIDLKALRGARSAQAQVGCVCVWCVQRVYTGRLCVCVVCAEGVYR